MNPPNASYRSLARVAQRLRETSGWYAPALPALFLVTDPRRVPDPVALASRLPPGTGVIYRAFGDPEAVATGRGLMAVAHRRGLTVLVGADASLAVELGADGIHLPERSLGAAPRLRGRFPSWIITGAAHGEAALRRAARLGFDAALLSPVFESRSPSAGRPLGPVRFAKWVRSARLPVFALGGVNAGTAPRLLASQAFGIASIDGVVEAFDLSGGG
ncbi:MAG: thiamine phosphate synthase [Caulobacteraceae bacterium]